MINDKLEARPKEPIKRFVDKGLEGEEHTPMDPPDAYSSAAVETVTETEFSAPLRQLMREHTQATAMVQAFESALVAYREAGYVHSAETNGAFIEFFKYFDENLMAHNEKEDKFLFPILREKLIEHGEHGTGPDKTTATDVMEDDHVKFIQLGTLSFNFFGLAMRLRDPDSRRFVLDTAYENARELVELLRLHIYREDHTLFPLAQKYLSIEDFAAIEKKIPLAG